MTALRGTTGFLPAEDSLSTLVDCMQPRLPAYSLGQLVTVGWGLSRLGFRPPAAWLRAWMSAVCGVARGLCAREASLVLAACAEWRVPPSRQLMQLVTGGSVALCGAGQMSAVAAARILTAMAILRCGACSSN
jgi:hypothetical protein